MTLFFYYFFFLSHGSRIPCWGWDQEIKKLASSCQSQNPPAMMNIKPKIREQEKNTEELIIVYKKKID